MATEVFGKGASEFGMLGSAVAVGSLTGRCSRPGGYASGSGCWSLAALAFGVVEIVAGLMPSYVAFALFAPLIGLSTMTLLTSANATMQLETDPGCGVG